MDTATTVDVSTGGTLRGRWDDNGLTMSCTTVACTMLVCLLCLHLSPSVCCVCTVIARLWVDNFGIFSNQWVTLSSAVRHKVTTADIEMDASNTATLTASSCTMVGGLLLSHAAVAYRCLVFAVRVRVCACACMCCRSHHNIKPLLSNFWQADGRVRRVS